MILLSNRTHKVRDDAPEAAQRNKATCGDQQTGRQNMLALAVLQGWNVPAISPMRE